ncbi:MAG: oligosaccharide flippase family protein [Myxococcota bacterium]|jgi:O-antigen/teichoic acid export membrane protein|nr:oligosaccharide flippase family protein [Myxococcota bacterium]MEC9440836.1 oligosaccharide flippase family protein [Myxococcota bacterium]
MSQSSTEADEETLGQKMARALSYSTLITVVLQALGFLRSIILAKLLLPTDFGLYGLVMTVVTGLQVFTQLGVQQVVITTPVEDDAQKLRWASTAWWVNLIKGTLLLVTILAVAPLFGDFFDEPRLVGLLRLAALVPFFQMISSVGLIYLNKELDLKRLFYWEGIKGILSFCVTVGLCYWLESALALVIGVIFSEAFGAFLSYIVAPMWPKFALDRPLLKRVARYTRSTLPVAVLTFVTTQVDDIAIGKILGARELGYYTLAYGFALLPIKLISEILDRTLLPAFSQAIEQGGIESGAKLWQQLFEAIAWLLAIILFPIFYFHEEVIEVFYGAKWSAAAPLLAIMLWLGLFRSWTLISGRMLYAIDKPEVNARAKMVETILFLGILFYLVPRHGAVGGAIAGLVNYILAFSFRSVYVVWRCGLPWGLLPRAALKLATAFALVAPIWWVARGQGALSLLAGLLAGGLIAALAYRSERELIGKVRENLKRPEKNTDKDASAGEASDG